MSAKYFLGRASVLLHPLDPTERGRFSVVGEEARAWSCGRAQPSSTRSTSSWGTSRADRLADRHATRRARRSPAARAAPSASPRRASCTGRRRPRASAGLAISSTALNRYGNSSRLTTNPGMSGTSTAVLPSASHSAQARSRVAGAASPRERQLDQLHPRHRVEHVQADEPLRVAAWPARARSPTATTSWSRIPPPAPRAAASSVEHRGLAAVVLDYRLDQECGVGEGVEAVDDPAPVRGRRPRRRASSTSWRRCARARSAEAFERAHSSTSPPCARRSPPGRRRSRPSRRFRVVLAS